MAKPVNYYREVAPVFGRYAAAVVAHSKAMMEVMRSGEQLKVNKAEYDSMMARVKTDGLSVVDEEEDH